MENQEELSFDYEDSELGYQNFLKFKKKMPIVSTQIPAVAVDDLVDDETDMLRSSPKCDNTDNQHSDNSPSGNYYLLLLIGYL